jgi:hypothetical protein
MGQYFLECPSAKEKWLSSVNIVRVEMNADMAARYLARQSKRKNVMSENERK